MRARLQRLDALQAHIASYGRRKHFFTGTDKEIPEIFPGCRSDNIGWAGRRPGARRPGGSRHGITLQCWPIEYGSDFMDNLSHTVAGLVAGELIHRSLRPEADAEGSQVRRRLLLIACAVASNFPDLDLVLTPLLPAPLGYLLHHRGHTHTLLYALPQAFLVWAAIWLCWPAARALLRISPAARKGFVLALAAGLSLHLLMDYLNSYGVHPFHPADSRWLFGDMVFILEPVFWVAFGVPLAMTARRRWVRAALLVPLLGAPLYFTLQGYLPWASMVVLGAAALLLGGLQQRSGTQGRAGLAAAALAALGFVGVQGAASSAAKEAVVKMLGALDPASRVLDAAMTSFPTNPVCWSFVSVESNEREGTYRLRRGTLSLAPQHLPVSQCPPAFLEPPARASKTAAIVLLHEEQGALQELRALRSGNCHFEAWMRFARAPSVNGASASDLRYSGSLRDNFSTIALDEWKERPCPRRVPQWAFPRADLLGEPGSAGLPGPDD